MPLRIPPCSQRPEAPSTPGHVQCVHGSIQRLQLRRRAFHNSLFPDPHALTGPRPPPCNPSHMHPLCSLHVACFGLACCSGPCTSPCPALPSTSLAPAPLLLPVRIGTATSTSLTTLPTTCTSLLPPDVTGPIPWRALQVCLPCLALPGPALPCPALPAAMGSPTPLDAYTCGAFTLSGVIPTPSSQPPAGPQHQLLLLDCHSLQI